MAAHSATRVSGLISGDAHTAAIGTISSAAP
jgi:hypothetical protein